jgi:hypothetical protein
MCPTGTDDDVAMPADGLLVIAANNTGHGTRRPAFSGRGFIIAQSY